jgi:hypothetical protein
MERADDTSPQSALQLLHCPPPRNFRPAGRVEWALPDESPPAYLTRPRRYRGRRAQGVRYERRFHETFTLTCDSPGPGQLHWGYFQSPWFRFSAGETVRWCQPDGIACCPGEGRLVILEVKYQHTPDAWFQLRELYEPVVRAAFGSAWTVGLVEVVKWYDPAVYFPERIVMCPDPLRPPEGAIGLHIWNP